MDNTTALVASETLFTLAIIMIVVTLVTMLTVRKRRTRDDDAATIEFIRNYEAEKAAQDIEKVKEKLRLSSQYGKYPNGHYYGGLPKYSDSDSIHEIDIDI